ncbi:MAG: type I restriction-modification system subunit M, partial [Acidobacteria bacterium]|nr:type I restriction-modification system subunit M [Acidobacteriota bacterium]
YILGFIFFKYLSERMNTYADSILEEDGITFQSIDEKTAEGKQYLEAIKEESVETLGYFLKPSELFSAVARRGNGNGKAANGDKEDPFILEDLARILNNIEQSTMGTESEDDFDNLFEDLDLTSTKLGRTESAKNELISKVLAHLDKIDFRLEDSESDVLGDAYEYLIGQFASGAGKKAGEFYTPQEVSKVLAKLVTVGKDKLKTVYDPTCGSGSLLLRVAREVKEVGKFYGQELNRTTYNLARMNMILHGVNYQKFDLRQEDSLEHPQHLELRAEAIVANPPFSAKWSANQLHLGDDRFSQYGRLAPGSKADFAFIQHMVHHLADNGTMAVVVPHGVLFRGGAEGHIRQYLIEDRNYLDAVIGLPANIFYGTSIPTCVLVFKKCKESFDDILFIDASQNFEKRGNQNYLRDGDIERIVSTFVDRSVQDKFSYVATLDEVKENDFNLNIPRYVDTFEADDEVDLEMVSSELRSLEGETRETDNAIADFCRQLGISAP